MNSSASLYLCLAFGALIWCSEGYCSDESEFLARYRNEEPTLYDQYLHNRRLVIDVRSYDMTEPTGVLSSRATHSVVAKRDAFRADSIYRSAGKTNVIETAVMWLEDEVYNLAKVESGGYALVEYYLEATHGTKLEQTVYQCNVFLPLSFNGGFRLTKHFEVFERQKNRGGPSATIRSVGEGTHNGRRAIKLVTDGVYGDQTIAYFDAENHLAFLGFETDGILDPRTRKNKGVKVAGAMVYGNTPNESFPVPVSYESWFVTSDGQKVPRIEVKFTDFSKYEAADSDFDLEKQFGIKPFPKSPRSKVSSGRAWWLYGGAVALGLLTVGVWLRRRHTRTRAARSIEKHRPTPL